VNAPVQSLSHRRRAASRRIGNHVAEHAAVARLGGSNYGVMCAEVARYVHRSERCGKCDGLGFVAPSAESLAKLQRDIAKIRGSVPDISEARSHEEERRIRNAVQHRQEQERDLRRRLERDSVCSRCAGTGFLEATEAPFARPDSMWTTIRCSRCRGGGEGERLRELDGELVREEVSAGPGNTRHTMEVVDRLLAAMGFDRCATCERCGGELLIVAITARPTGSTRSGRMPRGATDAGTEIAVATDMEDLVDRARQFRANGGAAELRELAEAMGFGQRQPFQESINDLKRFRRAFDQLQADERRATG
jgi:hypothetical protein